MPSTYDYEAPYGTATDQIPESRAYLRSALAGSREAALRRDLAERRALSSQGHQALLDSVMRGGAADGELMFRHSEAAAQREAQANALNAQMGFNEKLLASQTGERAADRQAQAARDAEEFKFRREGLTAEQAREERAGRNALFGAIVSSPRFNPAALGSVMGQLMPQQQQQQQAAQPAGQNGAAAGPAQAVAMSNPPAAPVAPPDFGKMFLSDAEIAGKQMGHALGQQDLERATNEPDPEAASYYRQRGQLRLSGASEDQIAKLQKPVSVWQAEALDRFHKANATDQAMTQTGMQSGPGIAYSALKTIVDSSLRQTNSDKSYLGGLWVPGEEDYVAPLVNDVDFGKWLQAAITRRLEDGVPSDRIADVIGEDVWQAVANSPSVEPMSSVGATGTVKGMAGRVALAAKKSISSMLPEILRVRGLRNRAGVYPGAGGSPAPAGGWGQPVLATEGGGR